MGKIINFAQTIRRHWKKSLFFSGVLIYGSSYALDRYKTFQMMRAYCEEAKKYGEIPLAQMTKPKHVTVILNPEANDKKANIQFEKWAAPLLHLAGFKVSVFQTEKEKQAVNLMKIMSNTDIVIVAGGNGTLQEVVTGLLSRPNNEGEQLPIGIIPLGKTNTVAEHLYGSKSSSRAQLMAEATMAIIRETTVSLDVLKIQHSNDENPVFAMCNFEQGVFADIEPLVGKYWYLGVLKDKFAYIRHCLKNQNVTVENSSVKYVAKCEGCSKCFHLVQKNVKQETGGRWWSVFIPKNSSNRVLNSEKDYSKVINEECGKHLTLNSSYTNISASTISADPKAENGEKNSSGSMWIKLYPCNLSLKELISSGISHRKLKLKDKAGIANIVESRELIIETEEGKETGFYIDKEKYPGATSYKIMLLPKLVTVFG